MKHDRTITFSSGEVIFQEGDDSDAMYIIKDGLVRIKRSNDSHILSFGQNQLFGEIGFLNAEPRSASAIAETRTELWKLTSQSLQFDDENIPAWYKKFFKVVSQRLKDMNDKLEFVQFEGEQLRLLEFLLVLSHSYHTTEHATSIPLAEFFEKAAYFLRLDQDFMQALISQALQLDILQSTGSELVIDDISRLKQYIGYLEITNTISKKIRNNKKYHSYSAKCINIAASLLQAVKKDIFLVGENSYVCTDAELMQYFPKNLEVRQQDIDQLIKCNILVHMQQNQYRINRIELESIAMFSNPQSVLQHITSTIFRKTLDYFTEKKTNKAISYHDLNQTFIIILAQEISGFQLCVLVKLGILEEKDIPSEYYIMKTPLKYMQDYIKLHDVIHSKDKSNNN